MRIGLRSFLEGVDRAQWAGWARVVGVALLGVGFFLPQVVVAQSWPASAPQAWRVYGCPWGVSPSTDNASVAEAMACLSLAAAPLTCSEVPRTSCGAGPHETCMQCEGDSSSRKVTYQGVCSSGWTLNTADLTCVNDTCTTEGGSQRVFDVGISDAGTCSGAAPTTVCFSNGCRGVVVQGSGTNVSCLGMPAASPPKSWWSGIAQTVTSEPCAGSDPVVTARNAASSAAAPSGGGVGITLGTGTNTATEINLARIATNTARMADAATSGGSSGGSCGGAGQPSCAIDEGDTATSGAAFQALQDGDKSAMGTVIDAQIAGTTLGNMPTFDQGGSKWTLSFLPFLTASGPLECEIHWNQTLAGVALTPGYNFCGFTDYVKAILYWIFAVGTVVGIWNMIYGRTE